MNFRDEIQQYGRKYYCDDVTEEHELMEPQEEEADGTKKDVVISFADEGLFLDGTKVRMYWIHDEDEKEPAKAFYNTTDTDKTAIPYFEEIVTKNGKETSQFLTLMTSDDFFTLNRKSIKHEGVDIDRIEDATFQKMARDTNPLFNVLTEKSYGPCNGFLAEGCQRKAFEFLKQGRKNSTIPDYVHSPNWAGVDAHCTSLGVPESVADALDNDGLRALEMPPPLGRAYYNPIDITTYYEHEDGTSKYSRHRNPDVAKRARSRHRAGPRVRKYVTELAAADDTLARVLPSDFLDPDFDRHRRSASPTGWGDVDPTTTDWATCPLDFEFDVSDKIAMDFQSCQSYQQSQCGQMMFAHSAVFQYDGGKDEIPPTAKIWGVCSPQISGDALLIHGWDTSMGPCNGFLAEGCLALGMSCEFGVNKKIGGKRIKAGVECGAELKLCVQSHPYPAVSGGVTVGCEAGKNVKVEGKLEVTLSKIGISDNRLMKPQFKVKIYAGAKVNLWGWRIKFGGWATIVDEQINQCLPLGDPQGNNHLDGCASGKQQKVIDCEYTAHDWGACVPLEGAECINGAQSGQKTRYNTITTPSIGGTACPDETEVADCTAHGCTTTTPTTTPTTTTTPAPINCVVSNWTDWSPCVHPPDATCINWAMFPNGIRNATRTILVEAQHGGTACPELEKSAECITPCTTTTTTTTTPEPIDCEEHWTSWSNCQPLEWKSCSKDGKRICRRIRELEIDVPMDHNGKPCAEDRGMATTQIVYEWRNCHYTGPQ